MGKKDQTTSAPANANGHDLSDRLRQTYSRVARAKPIFEQFQRGELLVMNSELQRLVEMYPLWLEDLEALRNGRFPSQRAPVLKNRRGASDAVAGVEEPPTNNACGKQNGDSDQGAGEMPADVAPAKQDEPPGKVGLPSLEDFLQTLAALESESAQSDLLDDYVASHMSEHSIALVELAEVQKLLDKANETKKKIIAGSIKCPSKAQLLQIEQLPALRKQVTNAKRHIKRDEQRLRSAVLDQLTALQAAQKEGCEQMPSGASGDGEQEAGCGVETDVQEEKGEVAAAIMDEESGMRDMLEAADDGATEPNELCKEAQEGAAETSVASIAEMEGVPEVVEYKPAPNEDPKERAISALDHCLNEATDISSPPPAAVAGDVVGIDWSKLKYSKNSPTFVLRLPRTDSAATPRRRKAVQQETDSYPPMEMVGSSVPDTVEVAAAQYVQRNILLGGAASVSVPADPYHPLGAVDSVLHERIVAEWDLVQRYPTPRVSVYRITGAPKEVKFLDQWHVDVSPIDGPFAGQPLHLVLSFPRGYPFLPPEIHSLVPLPHTDLMISTSGQENTLYLRSARLSDGADVRRGPSSWCPDSNVTVVLCELQTFFDADRFTYGRKSDVASVPEVAVGKARLAAARAWASCQQCSLHTVLHTGVSWTAPVFNGPFLTLDERGSPRKAHGSSTASTAAVVRDHCTGEDGVTVPEQHISASPPARATVCYEVPTSTAVQGPWRGCWGHLLYTVATADCCTMSPRVVYVCLRTIGDDVALPTMDLIRVPVTERKGRPRSVSSGGATSSNKSFKWPVEALCATSTDSDDAWRLPEAAWTDVGAYRQAMVCIHFDKAPPPLAGERVGASDMTMAGLPFTPPVDGYAWAMLLNVPAGTRVQVAFIDDRVPSNVWFDKAPHAFDSNRSHCMWPSARRLLCGHTADVDQDEAAVHGFLAGVPYGFSTSPTSGTPGASQRKLDEENYFVPRRVSFHCGGTGMIPAVMSEDLFLAYRALLLPRWAPLAAEAAGAADHYLVAGLAGERRQRTGGHTGYSHSMPTDVSMWGSRAVFVPFISKNTCTALATGETLRSSVSDARTSLRAEMRALERFRRTCVQLYRHPAASAAYDPPCKPLHVLHVLALTLDSIVSSYASLRRTSCDSPLACSVDEQLRLLSSVYNAVLRTSRCLALYDASIGTTCERILTGTPSIMYTIPFVSIRVLQPTSSLQTTPQTNGEEVMPIRDRALAEMALHIVTGRRGAEWYETRLWGAMQVAAAVGIAMPSSEIKEKVMGAFAVTDTSSEEGLPAARLAHMALFTELIHP